MLPSRLTCFGQVFGKRGGSFSVEGTLPQTLGLRIQSISVFCRGGFVSLWTGTIPLCKTTLMLANITKSATPPAPSLSASRSQMKLGRLILAAGLLAFLLMPIGHGCGLTHKHPNDEEDDGVAFRLGAIPKSSHGPKSIPKG